MINDSFTLNIRGSLVDLSAPKIMGVLNVTPDSFSDGGKFTTTHKALRQAEKMIQEGADFIDIGAQSTRPHAEKISALEEIERLSSIISQLKKEFPDIIISLDSFYAEVIKFGFQEGIDVINDISGGAFDPAMWKTVAETRLPYILMHSNPTYEAMHEKQIQEDIIVEINKSLSKKLMMLNDFGINDVVIDPGFGFGKTIEQQYKMIDELEFIGLNKAPLLIGISRKSFIYKTAAKSPLEIGVETEKLHLKVLKKGAKILRVHDVLAARKTVEKFLLFENNEF